MLTPQCVPALVGNSLHITIQTQCPTAQVGETLLKTQITMKQLLNNPETMLVDVRSDWEYEGGHLPNAINIPLEDIAFRLHELKQAKGPIVLYCRSGNRSGMAARFLQQAGIQNIYNGGAITDLNNLTLN
jgi:phage shock protein E